MVALRPAFSSLQVHSVGHSVGLSGPPIAFCCDERYAFQQLVALASIFLNSASRTLDLVVFANRWRDTTLVDFDRLARRFGRSVTIVRVDDEMLPPSFTSPYVPRATYFRLMVPEIIESDRLLFLDTDIVAQIDLDEIWRDYRDDSLVGGVPDFHARDLLRSFGSPEPETYINGGVLLINGRRWREGRAMARCVEWVARHGNRKFARFADQNPLNNALAGDVYYVPGHWNVVAMNQPRGWRLDPDTFRGIYHFAGGLKPWMRYAEPVLKDFYLHYARLVGLPADYWIEVRNAGEAMIEAHWAEEQGDVAKACDIYKRVANAAVAKLKESSPQALGEIR